MSLICSYLLLSIFSLVTFEKLMTKLMKSINTSFTNLIRGDLARVRKIGLALCHAAAWIKV